MGEYDRLDNEMPMGDQSGGSVPARVGQTALDSAALTPLLEVSLQLDVQLGAARVPIRELLELRAGAVIALDRGATDPVDIYAGGKLIARGEVVSVDGQLGVRITEILEAKGQP